MKFSRMETPSEKPMRRNGSKAQRAFTLIEILVVIAIISALAALGTQGAKIAARKRDYSRVETQLERLKLVIEDYKLRFGTYPPDNQDVPPDSRLYADSRLYDELRGNGILNKPGSANPARQPKDYLPTLQADEWVIVTNQISGFTATYLTVSALPLSHPGDLVRNTVLIPPDILSQLLAPSALPADYFIEVYVGPDPKDPFAPLPARFLPFWGKFRVIAIDSPTTPPNKAVGLIYKTTGRQRLVSSNGKWRGEWDGEWERNPNVPNVWNYNSSSPTNTLAGYDLWAEYAERGTLKPIIISNGK